MRESLGEIVGRKYVFDEPEILEAYSRDQSFVRSSLPDFVVVPKDTEEVQEIFRFANKNLTPIVPYSSGLNLHGGTIPDQGGIVVNFSRMDKVLEVNERNKYAVIEPGVSYRKLQEEFEKHSLRAMIPLGVPGKRSVISSYMERDPALTATSFEYGNYFIMDMEIILPEGEMFRTGSWAMKGFGPGSNMGPGLPRLYMFFQGAQGTLGAVTKLVVHGESLPRVRKVLFLTFDSIKEAVANIKEIQTKEIGLECFGLNSFNLAALLAEEWTVPEKYPAETIAPLDFEALRKALPRWTFIICLSGPERRPEEKVEYETEDLKEVCSQLSIRLQETVSGTEGVERVILDLLLNPWAIMKKFRYKGSVHNLSFHTTSGRIEEFERLIYSIAVKFGYPPQDIGGYILPVERGRTFYCEFDFHCDLSNPAEVEQVKKVWLESSQSLINNGAFFSRPYGPWAEMVFSRAGTYTMKLKEIKKLLDPNNIMNPGKLCF